MDADESCLNLADAVGINGLLSVDTMGTVVCRGAPVVYDMTAGGRAMHSGRERCGHHQSRAKDKDEAYTKRMHYTNTFRRKTELSGSSARV